MKTYQVTILEFGYEDLNLGKSFYENQLSQLGNCFVNSILTDIESLSFYGDIHPKYEVKMIVNLEP